MIKVLLGLAGLFIAFWVVFYGIVAASHVAYWVKRFHLRVHYGLPPDDFQRGLAAQEEWNKAHPDDPLIIGPHGRLTPGHEAARKHEPIDDVG